MSRLSLSPQYCGAADGHLTALPGSHGLALEQPHDMSLAHEHCSHQCMRCTDARAASEATLNSPTTSNSTKCWNSKSSTNPTSYNVAKGFPRPVRAQHTSKETYPVVRTYFPLLCLGRSPSASPSTGVDLRRENVHSLSIPCCTTFWFACFWHLLTFLCVVLF